MRSHTMFKHILEVYDLSIAHDDGEWDVVAINKFSYEKSFLTNRMYTPLLKELYKMARDYHWNVRERTGIYAGVGFMARQPGTCK